MPRNRFQVRSLARTPEEVLAATTCVVEGGWGTYRQFHAVFSFYAANRRIRTFVARDGEGRVAGTSVATRYGRSGWIGHGFGRPDVRGLGLGARRTTAAGAPLRHAGCESILLASTELGRPVYERLGFKVETAYHEMRGTALPRKADLRPYRPLLPADRAGLLELDRQVSGEDRAALLLKFAGYAWGLPRDGRLVGAVIPLPWGGAAASMLPGAGEDEIASLVRVLRTVGSTGSEVVVYPPDENRLALECLRTEGFEDLRTVPRMFLGTRSEWMPAAVWNPMSLGLG